MTVRQQIEAAVQRLNQYLQPNYVHTFQFVSIDESRLNQLIWRTLSLGSAAFHVATVTFTEYDEGTNTIRRSLVRHEFLNGPFWYRHLGPDQILNGPSSDVPAYEFQDQQNASLLDQSSAEPDVLSLLTAWHTCLLDALGPHGSTMWVSQPHSDRDDEKIVSSVFAVFNGPLTGHQTRYGVARHLRDFIIDYLVGVYRDRVESQYKILERDYDSLLLRHSCDVYLSGTLKNKLKAWRNVISSGVPLLITGEPGTGKKVVARSIHALRAAQLQLAHSTPAAGSFGVVNCGQWAEHDHDFRTFLGSEGGALEQYRNGTLLVDDVHLCTRKMQTDLLELLEQDVGNTFRDSLDPRLIFTACHDLHEQVLEGTFMEDLFYRLNTFELALPTLRSRKAEIEQIADVILAELARHYNLTVAAPIKTLTPEALDEIKAHNYPGNYRELYNVLIRAFHSCPPTERLIDRSHIKV